MTTNLRTGKSGILLKDCTYACIFLLIGILAISGCSGSSSDTRTAAKNSTSGTYEINVQINQPPDNSTVLFHPDGTTDLTFNMTYTGGTEPYGITWTIEGPTLTNTASGEAPAITFYELGNYKITCTVVDGKGITGSDTIDIVVVDSNNSTFRDVTASIVQPGSNVTIIEGQQITFQASASGGTGTYYYTWDIPGAATSTDTGATPAAGKSTFNTAGTYTVKVTVQDNYGNTDTASVLVTVVKPTDLALTFTQPVATTFSKNTNYTLKVVASGGDGTYTYSWDDDDSSTTTVPLQEGSAAADATYTTNSATAKTVTYTVTVRDGNGETASASFTITIK